MNAIRKRRGTAVVFAMLALVAITCRATTYFVTTNGNDSALGTSWATALATIPVAMGKAVNTDTVMLSNGTFTVSAQIDLTNAVTITSANGRTYTKIVQSTSSARVFYMTNANAVMSPGLSISATEFRFPILDPANTYTPVPANIPI